jgi:putative membrane protein
MNDVFLVLGAVFAGIAALIHVAIFVLESMLWSRPATWKRFGVRAQADADILRPMAYNQGFYNLFLALGAGTSIFMIASAGVRQAGIALAIFTLLSMLLASIVLIASNPRLARAAMFQGLAPLLGIVFLVLALLG